MFEIPDDDNFWEDFPDDAIEGISANADLMEKEASATSVHNQTMRQGQHTEKDLEVVAVDAAPCENAAGGSTKKRPERKFPGPAGLLPKSPANNFTNNILEVDWMKSEEIGDDVCTLPSSQPSGDDVWSSSVWRRMLEDLGSDSETLLNKFSIKALLLRASRKMLCRGKAPLVFGMMESLDMQGPDASFVIRDETGSMRGSVHKDLILDPKTSLQTGCVLILRQVSVISPSTRTHYLNITPGNIVYCYSSSSSSSQQNNSNNVTRRSWPLSPTTNQNPPPTPSVSIKDSLGSPPLDEIIAESEQELAASIRSFYDRRQRSVMSPASSLTGVGTPPPHPGGRGPSSLYSTNSSPFIPPTSRAPYRPTFHPRGHSIQHQSNQLQPGGTRGPLPSAPGFKTHLPQPQISSLSECPIPERSDQLSTKVTTPVIGNTSMVTGRSAVRQREGQTLTNTTQNNSRFNFNTGAHSSQSDIRLGSFNTAMHSSSSISNNSTYNPAINKNCLGQTSFVNTHSAIINTSNSKLKPPGFDFDFPDDNIDDELASVCDETLGDVENVNFNQCGIPSRVPAISFPPSSTTSLDFGSRSNNVIDDMIQKCANEYNKDSVQNSPQTDIVEEPNSKKFTFKRVLSPLTPVSPDVGVNYSKRLCLPGTPTPIPNLLPRCEDSNRLPQASAMVDGVAAGKTKNLPQPPMFGSGQRDARVQLGQQMINQPVSESTTHVSNLGHWDEDLTEDDFLLSQLSEEF